MGENTAEGRLDGSTVTVTGVIDGSDTCHSAKLDGLSVESDQLDVTVVGYVPPENEGRACGECIVDISYEVTAEFDGRPPDSCVVHHDGEQVAEFSLE